MKQCRGAHICERATFVGFGEESVTQNPHGFWTRCKFLKNSFSLSVVDSCISEKHAARRFGFFNREAIYLSWKKVMPIGVSEANHFGLNTLHREGFGLGRDSGHQVGSTDRIRVIPGSLSSQADILG